VRSLPHAANDGNSDGNAGREAWEFARIELSELLRSAQGHWRLNKIRYPGPDYYKVLGWIHSVLNPTTYLEIGVASGLSLAKAGAETLCIAIDPNPEFGLQPLTRLKRNIALYLMSSEEFFKNHTPGTSVQLAFLDGSHLFEQVLSDLMNLEAYLTRESVVLVHDCLPLDAETAARTRTTLFWSGDVWKLIPYLSRFRPDLKIKVIRTAPTGLAVIRGFGHQGVKLEEVQWMLEYR
jgi:Methyltransferase domain